MLDSDMYIYLQGKKKIQGILDGSGSAPVSCPCFKLLKPSFDEVNQNCSIGNCT